ncbi:MAG: Asp-tRNA(Asn)/Glu-tRNA(Gln) amidotransferase subunit GatA [Oscillospiraceae bacterium]|jgi:aspartyl-tRNA(Asn)/glutamyl-tRNA(Gln) amidotransferase subunit A|nr:Asp-tRNA(Asn)/Glu-tRNA(Gln) amidotransferase subunit GatA [Oscillospiraceae bacterium]
MELTKLSIKSMREKLVSREITSAELLASFSERKDEYFAYVTQTSDLAVESAQVADLRIAAGENAPLLGIPGAVKDNICTDGIKTTCASKMLADFIPPYDADVVQRLKQSGYVLTGKTNMDEFAMGSSSQTSVFGGVKNPYDVTRVPGGSSGGSAAVVAARLAPFALGSDTGGSIRQPASFCGVTGIKPTYGRVSRYGLVAFASSLDQIGVFTKTAADSAEVLNVISGYDKRDATSANVPTPDFTSYLNRDVRGLRIALPDEYFGDTVGDDVRTAVLNAAKYFEESGATLVPCSMKVFDYAVSAYYLLACAEAASNLSRFDGVKYGLRGEGATYEQRIVDSRNKGFGAEVKRRILLGNYALSSGYYDAYYRKAQALRQEIIKEYNDVFTKADIILTPTAPEPAFKIGSSENDPIKMFLADICTVMANIAYLPGINTTCGYTDDGLPIGMSLIGKRFDEGGIIGAADFFERNFRRKDIP